MPLSHWVESGKIPVISSGLISRRVKFIWEESQQGGKLDQEIRKKYIFDDIVWTPDQSTPVPATFLDISFYGPCTHDDGCITPQFSGLKRWKNIFCS